MFSVLNLLFPHKKGKFDPLYAKYLSELTSYNLDKIVDEERVRLKQVKYKNSLSNKTMIIVGCFSDRIWNEINSIYILNE
jgi:hypothetical protein